MGKLQYSKEYGWYGSCSTTNPCSDLYLSTLGDNRENLESVVRTKTVGDATGYEKYTCYDKGAGTFTWESNIANNTTLDDYFNHNFDKMECGRGYLVSTNTQRNILGEWEIENFNVPSGDSFVSASCEEVAEIKCTEDNYETIIVREGEFILKNNISIQHAKGRFGGVYNVPPRDPNAGFLPVRVEVYIGTTNTETWFSTIIYNGGYHQGTRMYFSHDSGCYAGTIILEGGNRKCVLELNT